MYKYGEGLGIEIVKAVNTGELNEPLTTKSIMEFCNKRNWDVSYGYANVILANSSSKIHSLNYVKYFDCISKGKYVVKPEYK